MAIIIGKSFYFGTGFPKERLPAGWTLLESPGEWAKAKDPNGWICYLSLTHAYSTVVGNDQGVPFQGIDLKNPIPLFIPEP